MTNLPNPIDAKSKLRKEARKRRDDLGATHRLSAGQRVAAAGVELVKTLGGQAIGGYHPIAGELDVLFLLSALSEAGIAIALPVTPEGNKPLLFRRWSSGDVLIKGRFGVLEPDERMPQITPDILLVPLLAFERSGHRLGYGGGFYDRTLHALRGKTSVVAIGVGFDEQEMDTLSSDDHDEVLDWMLTPSRVWRIKG